MLVPETQDEVHLPTMALNVLGGAVRQERRDKNRRYTFMIFVTIFDLLCSSGVISTVLSPRVIFTGNAASTT